MLNPSRIAFRAAGVCALALALLAPAQAAPVLAMSTATSATGLDLTVRAQDVEDLYAYQFTLNFDPALLTAFAVTEGSFLSNAGSTFFYAGDIDSIAGSITFVLSTLVGPVEGVDGSGDLATISFDIVHGGFANFSLSDVFLLDSTGGVIDAGAPDLVAMVPEPASLLLVTTALVAMLGGCAIRRRTR